VFLPKRLGNPDNNSRVKAGRIGEELTKMVMICRLYLVLDQNPTPVGHAFGEDVGRERADLFLHRFRFKLESETLAKLR
jgi:hypothetical protein